MRLVWLAFAGVILLAATACGNDQSSSSGTSQIRTISQEHVPDTTPRDITATDTAPSTSTDDDSVSLPFEPPISMDPVDGSKVSIRRTTPTTEFEGKIYHFNSEEHLKLFLHDPKKYSSGSLATY